MSSLRHHPVDVIWNKITMDLLFHFVYKLNTTVYDLSERNWKVKTLWTKKLDQTSGSKMYILIYSDILWI